MGIRYFNTFTYLFVLIIVVGAFAAIAMNNYGVTLIATGCFGLSAIILLRGFSMNPEVGSVLSRNNLLQEYLFMGAILLLFGLRALRIKFDFVEIIFVLCSLLMIWTYALYLRKIWNQVKPNKTLSLGLTLLCGSVILFFTSMSLTFVYYQLAVIIGSLSFISGVGFIALHLKKGNSIEFKNSETSLFKEVFQYNNLSPLILSMILLMSTYMGLHQINVLPSLYTGDVPTRYQEFLEQNNESNEIGTEYKPKHEIYWDEYQTFLKYVEERDKKSKENE